MLYSLSTFIKPVSEALGFSRAQISLVPSIITFSGMFVYPLWGKLIGSWSIKRTMTVTGILMPLAILGYSFCSKLWQFYLLSVLLGIMMGSISTLPVTTLVNRWFQDSRGTATGLSTAGGGLGMVMIPVISATIVHYGWRVAYRVTALMLFLLIEVSAVLLIYDHPSDKGLEPYRKGNSLAPHVKITGITLAQAKRSGSYFLLLLITFLSCMANNCITQHLYAFATDHGFSPAFASSLSSVHMFFMMFSKFGIGYVFDKLGLKVGITISTTAYIICAVILLLVPGSAVAIVLAAASVGIGSALPSMSTAYMLRSLFGNREYTRLCSYMLSFAFLGNTAGTSISGLIYDLTGSYSAAWILVIVTLVLVDVAFVRMLRLRQKEEQRFAQEAEA